MLLHVFSPQLCLCLKRSMYIFTDHEEIMNIAYLAFCLLLS